MAKTKNNVEKNVEKKVKKKAKKVAKRNKGVVAAIIIAFIAFAAGGFFAAKYITANDGMTLNDTNKEIKINVGETYAEQGAKFVVFGKDASSLVKIEIYNEDGEIVDKVDSTESAKYDVVYSVESEKAEDFFVKMFIKKYKNYKQVRNVIVGAGD